MPVVGVALCISADNKENSGQSYPALPNPQSDLLSVDKYTIKMLPIIFKQTTFLNPFKYFCLLYQRKQQNNSGFIFSVDSSIHKKYQALLTLKK